jgi:hypothetical protein
LPEWVLLLFKIASAVSQVVDNTNSLNDNGIQCDPQIRP